MRWPRTEKERDTRELAVRVRAATVCVICCNKEDEGEREHGGAAAEDGDLRGLVEHETPPRAPPPPPAATWPTARYVVELPHGYRIPHARIYLNSRVKQHVIRVHTWVFLLNTLKMLVAQAVPTAGHRHDRSPPPTPERGGSPVPPTMDLERRGARLPCGTSLCRAWLLPPDHQSPAASCTSRHCHPIPFAATNRHRRVRRDKTPLRHPTLDMEMGGARLPYATPLCRARTPPPDLSPVRRSCRHRSPPPPLPFVVAGAAAIGPAAGGKGGEDDRQRWQSLKRSACKNILSGRQRKLVTAIRLKYIYKRAFIKSASTNKRVLLRKMVSIVATVTKYYQTPVESLANRSPAQSVPRISAYITHVEWPRRSVRCTSLMMALLARLPWACDSGVENFGMVRLQTLSDCTTRSLYTHRTYMTDKGPSEEQLRKTS
uniref:Uncharacterized protein n=1 Tax=Oryza sativa subsp. japonica TaxID=39947 RepID=Q6H832_ORYSJ|nr:hypothetical protein [Oryza sativa Japonica Group]